MANKSVGKKTKASDVDLHLILNAGMEHMQGCSAQYSSVWRGFMEFHEAVYDSTGWPPKEMLTDENV